MTYDGLVKGAQGTVVGFTHGENGRVTGVSVLFDDARVGILYRADRGPPSNFASPIDIEPATSTFMSKSGGGCNASNSPWSWCGV